MSVAIGLISMLVIGGLAGWIAGVVTEFRHGMLTNILVGVAGAYVGGTLAELLQIPNGFWRLLISATVGAIIIFYIWRRANPAAQETRKTFVPPA